MNPISQQLFSWLASDMFGVCIIATSIPLLHVLASKLLFRYRVRESIRNYAGSLGQELS